MKRINLLRLSLEQKKNIVGYIFVLPFLIGFALFVLDPIIRSVVFSISELDFTHQGYSIEYVGLSNYRFIFFEHPGYVPTLVQTNVTMLTHIPLILIFSFFIANLLNQEFRGRAVARLMFFLPVIMGAGIIYQLETRFAIEELVETMGRGEIYGFEELANFLLRFQLPEAFLEYIITAVQNIEDIVFASGVQILIFLAGLQSISPSLYEAADIDGATGWEKLWKITLPLLSPLILTNIVYSVIDFHTSPQNFIVSLIQSSAFGGAGVAMGTSTAMAWVYFLLMMLFIALSLGILSKWTIYIE